MQRRIDLLSLLQPHDDTFEYYEEVLYPVVQLLSHDCASRNLLHRHKLIFCWVKILPGHQNDEAVSEKAFVAMTELMCPWSSGEVDGRFVEQFLKADGPDVVLGILLQYQEASNSDMTVACLLPLLPLANTAQGWKWLEKEYYKIRETMLAFNSGQEQLSLSKEMKPNVKPLWRRFSDKFNTIQAAQAEIHGAELVAREEREKARRERKREKKRQRRQLQKTREAFTAEAMLSIQQKRDQTAASGKEEDSGYSGNVAPLQVGSRHRLHAGEESALKSSNSVRSKEEKKVSGLEKKQALADSVSPEGAFKRVLTKKEAKILKRYQKQQQQEQQLLEERQQKEQLQLQQEQKRQQQQQKRQQKQQQKQQEQKRKQEHQSQEQPDQQNIPKQTNQNQHCSRQNLEFNSPGSGVQSPAKNETRTVVSVMELSSIPIPRKARDRRDSATKPGGHDRPCTPDTWDSDGTEESQSRIIQEDSVKCCSSERPPVLLQGCSNTPKQQMTLSECEVPTMNSLANQFAQPITGPDQIRDLADHQNFAISAMDDNREFAPSRMQFSMGTSPCINSDAQPAADTSVTWATMLNRPFPTTSGIPHIYHSTDECNQTDTVVATTADNSLSISSQASPVVEKLAGQDHEETDKDPHFGSCMVMDKTLERPGLPEENTEQRKGRKAKRHQKVTLSLQEFLASGELLRPGLCYRVNREPPTAKGRRAKVSLEKANGTNNFPNQSSPVFNETCEAETEKSGSLPSVSPLDLENLCKTPIGKPGGESTHTTQVNLTEDDVRLEPSMAANNQEPTKQITTHSSELQRNVPVAPQVASSPLKQGEGSEQNEVDSSSDIGFRGPCTIAPTTDKKADNIFMPSLFDSHTSFNLCDMILPSTSNEVTQPPPGFGFNRDEKDNSSSTSKDDMVDTGLSTKDADLRIADVGNKSSETAAVDVVRDKNVGQILDAARNTDTTPAVTCTQNKDKCLHASYKDAAPRIASLEKKSEPLISVVANTHTTPAVRRIGSTETASTAGIKDAARNSRRGPSGKPPRRRRLAASLENSQLNQMQPASSEKQQSLGSQDREVSVQGESLDKKQACYKENRDIENDASPLRETHSDETQSACTGDGHTVTVSECANESEFKATEPTQSSESGNALEIIRYLSKPTHERAALESVPDLCRMKAQAAMMVNSVIKASLGKLPDHCLTLAEVEQGLQTSGVEQEVTQPTVASGGNVWQYNASPVQVTDAHQCLNGDPDEPTADANNTQEAIQTTDIPCAVIFADDPWMAPDYGGQNAAMEGWSVIGDVSSPTPLEAESTMGQAAESLVSFPSSFTGANAQPHAMDLKDIHGVNNWEASPTLPTLLLLDHIQPPDNDDSVDDFARLSPEPASMCDICPNRQDAVSRGTYRSSFLGSGDDVLSCVVESETERLRKHRQEEVYGYDRRPRRTQLQRELPMLFQGCGDGRDAFSWAKLRILESELEASYTQSEDIRSSTASSPVPHYWLPSCLLDEK